MVEKNISTRVDTSQSHRKSIEQQPLPIARVKLFSAKWAADLLTIVLLAIVAWTITRNFLNDSLFAWGDHPGQFMRFWYPLAHAIPESGHWLWGVLSWNPTWYAGYPEIQFYPPGATLLGIVVNFLTFAQSRPQQSYNLLPAIAFALPLFTCYAFLRYALAPLGRLPSILAGLAAGFLAISLKPMWGGIDGVGIGLMGERLAFAFAPIVLMAGWFLVERPCAISLALASLSLALLLLLHPFHAPALVIAVLLYALARLQWRNSPEVASLSIQLRKQFLYLGGWLFLSVALVAWWMLPLLAHYTPYAAALVRASTDQVLTWFDAGRIEWLWLAGLMALMLLAQRQRRVEATVTVLALLAPILVGAILLNDQVLLTRLNITFFDPIRFIAEYYLALILLVGCAVAAITSRFLWRIPWLAVICAAVLFLTLRPYVTLAWSDLQARIAVPPASRLDGMLQHPAFSGYWEAIRNDPTAGRVFFVSNYLFLSGEDGEVTPTTINSMTPYLTGREIVGGTFSHWSPVARWLWVGDPRAKLLPAQVESGDNQQIFGKSWDQLPADELAESLESLNVTTIVASTGDQQAIAHLDTSPHFSHYWQNDFFTMYHLVSNNGEWIQAQGATAHLLERSTRKWIIEVQQSANNAALLLKMSHYPLWHASIDGNPIPLTATGNGLQEIALPAGGPYLVEVEYREGLPEWSGLLISLSCLLLIGILILRRQDVHK